MVFSAIFKKISIISRRSDLLVEETRKNGVNHRPVVAIVKRATQNHTSDEGHAKAHFPQVDKLKRIHEFELLLVILCLIPFYDTRALYINPSRYGRKTLLLQ